jgi:hypothetical protein
LLFWAVDSDPCRRPCTAFPEQIRSQQCSLVGRNGAAVGLRREVSGDTAYIVWTAETADNRFEVGTDTFIVQNGKILTQTFAGKISPKH